MTDAKIEKELRAAVVARGATLKDCGGGHFQILGDRLVNYWPFSKTRTAHIKDTPAGAKHIPIAVAVDMAFLKPVTAEAKAIVPKPTRGFRKVSHLFGLQRGLCSICAGPMKLVNIVAMPKPERKRFFKDSAAVAMVATIDHTLPKSLARGVDNNTRAAHHACNGVKGNQLLEPYPLPCYDKMPLPKIKLAPGVYLDMEAP